MLDWFAAAVTNANAVKDISKSLVTLRDEEMIRSRVFELTTNLMELQQQLMTAQLEQMTLIKRIEELESELKKAQKQDDLTERYIRHRFETGHHAYVLRSEFQEGEPEHFLCSRCFENGLRITLQGKQVLKCPHCKAGIRTASGHGLSPRVISRLA